MYRFLEHTADVCVECRGETFPALLQSATDALYAVALHGVRHDNHSDGPPKQVSLTADNYEEALVRWVQELIFLLETENFVADSIVFVQADSQRIVSQASGYVCAARERAEEVKSATYHGLRVEHKQEGFVAQIIFDL